MEFPWVRIVLLADLFLYSYEAEFIKRPVREKNTTIDVAFNSTFTCRYDVLSINNNYLNCYVNSLYPGELEIKDTTDFDISVSYLNILHEKDAIGNLTTKLYDKLDNLNFSIVIFPY